jgi:MFS family permease
LFRIEAIRTDKNFNIMALSTFFSVGWFSISFVFPLLALRYNYTYSEIGLLGIFFSVPFIIISYLYTKFSILGFRNRIIMSVAGLSVLSLLFFVHDSYVFIILVCITDILQAVFWITVEISLGYVDDPVVSEKYSTAWGIPNFIVPLGAGVVLEYLGFRPIFIIASVSFILGLLFIPEEKKFARKKDTGMPKLIMVLPMLFAGVFSGFFYYVMIPYLRVSGLQYIEIGIASFVPPMILAFGFAIMSTRPLKNISRTVILSSLLLATPLSLLIYNVDWFIVGIAAIASVGNSLAFGRVLSYTSSTSSPEMGIFYYEGLFAVGFIIGSVVGGFLFEIVAFYSVVFVFSLPLFYSAWFYYKSREDGHIQRNVQVSGNR